MASQRSKPQRRKITKRMVDALPTPMDGKRVRIYDTALAGFGLTKHSSGKVSFFVGYGGRGNQRWFTFGKYGALTVEQARLEAGRLLGEVAKGGDPAEKRKARRAMPNFSAWIKDYLKDVDRRKKVPGVDHRYLKWAEKSWGRRPLNKITTPDVARAFEDRRANHGKISANRFLASVRACFQAAWRAEWVTENVAARVRLLPENQPRERVRVHQPSCAQRRALVPVELREVPGKVPAKFRARPGSVSAGSERARCHWRCRLSSRASVGAACEL